MEPFSHGLRVRYAEIGPQAVVFDARCRHAAGEEMAHG
jgi:hypothetical protein